MMTAPHVASGAPSRVALLLESDGPGGAEMMLLQLAEELRRRGHYVLHVGPANGAGWLSRRFREEGFDSATFSQRWSLDPACVRGLTRLFRQHGIDVVHSHEFAMAVYGAAAAGSVGAPHVITMHGGRYYAERWRRRAALRWAARRSTALVAVSRATGAELARTLGLDAGEIMIVPNGIPFRSGNRMILRRELGVLPNELLIVAVGNLYPVKGHAVLLRALAGLVHDAPATPWRLAIAGRGEAEAALRSFASEAGIADRVHLLGFRTDVADILAAADVFVMPSLSEGLPLALVEAMSASLPIVASDVGGIPEVVERDAEALLTPPDDAGAIAEALARLLADADMRAALGAAAGRRALRDFGVERMGDAYERLYRTPRWGTSGPAGSGVVAAPVSRDGR
jgi:glycosyltransferase involved in cell wall biosynthesis